MKKILSTLCTIVFLLTSTSVYAYNSTEEMEKILISVKSRLKNTEQFTEFSSNSSSGKKGTIYDFNWNSSDEKNYSSLNVSCNDQGVITYYSFFDSEKNNVQEKLSITRTKKAEALTIAKEELKRLNPEISDNLIVYDTQSFEDFRNTGYHFQIQRYENGIPVLSDTGWINLNPDCSLKNFRITYTTGFVFENADTLIPKNTALTNYNQKIGLDLFYVSNYNENNEISAQLVYSQKNDNNYISATNGEIVHIKEIYNTYFSNNLKQESASDMIASGSSSLREMMSEAELKTILEVENLLSKDDIDKIIKDCIYFNIPENIVMSSSSLYKNDSKNTYFYNISYKQNDESSDVTINAKTGEIISFYKWSDMPSDISADENKINTKTNEIISYLAKDKANEFRKNDSENKSSFNKTYTRYINDIPFYENTISVSFDKDYNLTRYNLYYDDISFPKPENIISPSDALKTMDSLNNYEIYYLSDPENNKFIPVYTFTEQHFINAHTNKSSTSTLENIYDGKYTDISGHYAEDKIKTLSSYGIFLDGTDLKPDDTITQKDYIALLSIVFYNRDTSVLRNTYKADALYNTLPDNLFADYEINPSATLTRSEAAKLMVKAMGADEYACLSDIYASLYNDVTENIGYINILTGLGVLSGDGSGNFNPNKNITRAHALIMIYNYLAR